MSCGVMSGRVVSCCVFVSEISFCAYNNSSRELFVCLCVI